ncbi:MAG: hypothetical protein R2791_02220 [Saprospiraceae bacterium]
MKFSPAIQRLYNLIRTLTWIQKRDFKKYAKFWGVGKKDAQRYVRLFNAIQYFIRKNGKQEDLTDFLLLKKGFGNKPGDVSDLCKYLYEKILESMRTTPDGAVRYNRLNALMQDIAFLYNKNLFSECQSLITKGLEITRVLDNPSYELELYLWKARLNAWQISSVIEYNEWLLIQDDLLARQRAIVECEVLAREMKNLNRRTAPISVALKDHLEQLYADFEAGDIEKLSLRAKIGAYSALAEYYIYMHKHKNAEDQIQGETTSEEKALQFRENVIRLFSENKQYADEEQLRFTAELDVYVNQCLVMNRPVQFINLESGWDKENSELIMYRNVAYRTMQYHLLNNEFLKAKLFFERENIAAGLEKHQHRIVENRLLAIRFTIGQIYYALDDFDHASDWFVKVAYMNSEVRPDVVLPCKVLEAICLWERKVYEHTQTRPIPKLRRNLKRAGMLDAFVKDILDAVELVFRHPTGLKKTNLAERLEKLKNDRDGNKSRTYYYLIIVWLRARLHRTSINKEILKFEPS